MTHKSSHVIIQMSATEDSDPIQFTEVRLDITGKTPEESAVMTKRVLRKLESMPKDDDE